MEYYAAVEENKQWYGVFLGYIVKWKKQNVKTVYSTLPVCVAKTEKLETTHLLICTKETRKERRN